MGKILSWIRIVMLSLVLTVVVGIGLLINVFVNFSIHAKFRLRSIFCKIAILILGIKVEVSGTWTREQGPYLYLCNHRSLLDPIICARYIKAYFLSKAEVANYPVLGIGSDLTGTIFVERDKKGSRSASREAMLDVLKSGKNVIVFPEGTTNGADYTKRFYRGSFEVAKEANAKIIPVVLEYKHREDYWVTPGLLAKSVEQFSKWRTTLHFWMGEPFDMGDAMTNLTECQKRIDDKIEEVQLAWGNSMTRQLESQETEN